MKTNFRFLRNFKLLIQNYTKFFLGKFRKPFFCLGVCLTIFLFGALVLGSNLTLKSLSVRDFSFLSATVANKFSTQELFIEPAKSLQKESPEMVFVQENSLTGVSSPVMIAPQILGSILGGVDLEGEIKKEINQYAVKSGDSLSSIAAKFNISLNTILWANDLSESSVIRPGQELIILPVSGILYLVKKGGTLSEIAEVYNGEIEEIIEFNELSNEGDIFIGDIIIIPGGKMPKKISRIALTPLAESYFIFPSQGKITQSLHPLNAIDIANECRTTPVVAAASGVVQRAGSVWVGGNRITILHPNGVVTYYGHLSAILVKPGQQVSAGDIIGYIGNTGYTLGVTGCHLHFEVRGAKNFLSKYPVGTHLSWEK